MRPFSANPRRWCSVLVALTISTAAASPPTPAQDYLIHAWQTDDGLPQNWISSLAQTPDGYLWVGTRYGGLARFDGVRFVPFNPQNTPDLKDVQVEHLSVDETGSLWVIMGNESVTAWRDGKFTLYRWPRAQPRLRTESVLSVRTNSVLFAGESPYLVRLNLAVGTNGWQTLTPNPSALSSTRMFWRDRDDAVWYISAERKLARFVNNQSEEFAGVGGLPENRIAALAMDGSKRLWVATPSHLAVWNGRTFDERTPANGSPPTNILQMVFAGDGGLWVLEENRLRKWVSGEWAVEVRPKFVQTNQASDLFRLFGDAAGDAWLISYGHGLWHVKADGTARQLTEREGLPSAFITCWFQDSEGNVWIGTAGGGMARIRERVFRVLGPAEGLPDKVARSVCVDTRGGLWAGTMSGGLARWQDGRLVSVPLPPLNSSPIESVTVCPDPSGALWVGTLRHGLMQLESGRITRPISLDDSGNSIRVLFEDRQGRLWYGGLVDLYRCAEGNVWRCGASDGWQGGIAVGAIAEDATGDIWIGTGPGDLWRCHENRFTKYAPPPEWPSVRFAALLPDTNGVIWVGTLGGGLLRFQDGQFKRFTVHEGLPDNHISQLLEDSEGHLWAGTYAGIFRVRKAELHAVAAGEARQLACRVYGRFDGLPALECPGGFQPSCWRSQEGRLWFTTANGLVFFDPPDVIANRLPPRVIVEEMLVDGKPRPLLPQRSSLRIEPGRHYVQFRFTGLSFAAPDAVRFRVKLEGVEDEWQESNSQRQVGYGPLPPGEYKLRVIACNNEGVWNEQGDTLAFLVLPFVWQTWWFRAGMILVSFVTLASGVAFALRRRYRLKLERLERQRAMERERARIAQDLHDDLGTSLTQISMLSALAGRSQTPPEEVGDILSQMRGLARAMVTALDEIVWAVNPRNDSIVELSNYLGHFAEEFFRPTAIRCRLDIADSLPAYPLSAEVRHHLFLAFKEAINNAARHSHAAQVWVRIEVPDKELVIRVEDDGQGFDAQNPGHRAGNGLANMQRRMEQSGGCAELESGLERGTSVTLRLPLDPKSAQGARGV